MIAPWVVAFVACLAVAAVGVVDAVAGPDDSWCKEHFPAYMAAFLAFGMLAILLKNGW